ncbi:ABC transporter substrate binding protein [Bradyrhizobium sp.]|uniref:ABC transporter substrate binding protein n=1 Tax=Bradyrhizobium sp. TaxID=376 RepID=UPI003BAE7476
MAVTTRETMDAAFSEIARDGFEGVLVTGSTMFNERKRIASLALAHRMPAQAIIGEMARESGILFSYGQDFPEFFRKAAVYVDKILKGASPADLPVEQPTRFKLVVNLETAKALSLTVPTSMLLSADEVIE